MNDAFRRLAVFVDNPRPNAFLWLVIESTEDPSVWLDLETGDDTFSSWIEAFQAGNDALLAYVDDENTGPLASRGSETDDDADNED